MKSSTLANILLAALALPSFALALEPPPGGGYPNATTALGDDALLNDVSSAGENTAIGYQAMYNLTLGSENVALGDQALHESTTAAGDVAVGSVALYYNTIGESNVAVGAEAMLSNTTANEGTAVGTEALRLNTTGPENTAIGFGAMNYSTGSYNTAVGAVSMSFDLGDKNVAVGFGTLNMGGSGSNNTIIGYDAGGALTGSNNVVLGYLAGSSVTASTSNNNIEIGNVGTGTDNAVIRLGDLKAQKKTFIAGISKATISGGAAVMVSSTGQLGVASSSARFKDNIQPMKDASEAILSLKPVTFRYKKELDSLGIPQFGLVAEDVAKVDPDLVIRDDSGKPFTVRYEAVNAMLLNEFLKEHRKVEEQRDEIGELKSALTEMKATLKAQAAQIQKVSAQVQAEENAPRLVATHE